MVFQTGETVGAYRITEQLGQGGMATVYKGYHANLDRYVAIKVLHPAFKEDPNFLERFKREAQIVAKLEHANIIPIYDYALHNGHPYLVMKFVEGQTLKARLKRGPLTLDESVHILSAVAQALTYAHERGILHRDVKPSNVMLDNTGTPYMADFGLARIAQAGESTMSQDMMLGTPQYISPEQAKGLHDLGPSTDIYSLGVMLYEITVGRVPFNADTPYAIVHDHIYKPLPLPTQVNPQVPPEVERVLLRALDKDPAARYESAVTMIEAFHHAIQVANMTELSAAHYRPQELAVSSTATTAPPDAIMPQQASVPAATNPPISPPPGSTPVYVGVPAPHTTSSTLTQKEAYRRRANLWILGGFGLFLLTCLGSLFIIVRAVSDPDSQPWNVDKRASAADDDRRSPDGGGPGSGQPPVDFTVDMSVEEAQSLIGAEPDNPMGYFYLAFALGQSGDMEGAFTNITQTIDRFQPEPAMLAQLANGAAQNGYHELAAWLYLEALAVDPIPLRVREEAGLYLYMQTQEDPTRMRILVNHYITRRNDQSAFAYTIQAFALLELDGVLNRRQARNNLDDAIALDNTLAEFYLVRGAYYLKISATDQALNDWEHVMTLPDAPGWVVEHTTQLLDEHSPTDTVPARGD